MSKEQKELFEFGKFRLDVGERKLERLDGSPTNGSLREKAFDVLVHLVRNRGRLVTRNELIAVTWPDAIVEEANLSKAIHEIRQFLGEVPGEQKYIETVPKHGYRFVADVERIERESSGDADAGAGAHEIVRMPAESRSGEGRESTRDAATDDHIRHSNNSAEPRSPNSRALWVAALVLIGVLGFGGMLATTSWWRAQSPPQVPLSTSAADDHSRAYDLYVRGKVKAGSENREDIEAAITLLEEAVANDPKFAEAWTQLARVYNTMAFKFSSQSEARVLQESADVAVEKALDLNPGLASAHFARGLILWTKTKGFPHEQAIEAFEKSLELDPNADETHHQLSMVYAHVGLLDKAQKLVRTAIDINPNNTMARFRVGNYLAWQGRFEEALTVLKTVPSDVSPMLVERIKAETLIQIGRVDEAQAIVAEYLNRYQNDEGGSFTSVNALLLARAGKRKEAEDAINRATEIGKGFGHFHHTAYNIASAYAVLNEPDEAVEWLEAAADDGFPCYSYFSLDPNLENLRNHPRFSELMSTLRGQWERFWQSGG